MDIASSTPLKTPQLNGLKQLNIMPFESDDETAADEEVAFSSLLKLLQSDNSIQLAIFINFALVHAHAEPILFYLITNLFKQGNVEELKHWAYEIFSSFIAADAPLQIFTPEIQDKIAAEIDIKLTTAEAFKSDHMEMVKALREIFNHARFETMKVVNEQLKNFQNKRRAGLDSLYGMSPLKDIKNMDQEMASKTIEKNLMPKLLVMLEELEECKEENSKLLLLISALSTVIYQTFRPAISYIEPVSQFVSKTVTTFDVLEVKGHNLTSKVCHSTTYCDLCLQVMIGIAPQGFECGCGIKVHRACIEALKGTCILHIEHLTINETAHNESKDSSKLYELVHSSIGNRRVDNYKRSKSNRPKSDPGKQKIIIISVREGSVLTLANYCFFAN